MPQFDPEPLLRDVLGEPIVLPGLGEQVWGIATPSDLWRVREEELKMERFNARMDALRKARRRDALRAFLYALAVVALLALGLLVTGLANREASGSPSPAAEPPEPRAGVLSVCASLLSGLEGEADHATRLGTCVEVAERARVERVPVSVALALAWHEAKFVRLPSEGRSVRGPLQVAPRYHCPGRKADRCDLVLAGVRLLGRKLREAPSCEEAVLEYNGGPSWRERPDADARRRWARSTCRQAGVLERELLRLREGGDPQQATRQNPCQAFGVEAG